MNERCYKQDPYTSTSLSQVRSLYFETINAFDHNIYKRSFEKEIDCYLIVI